tara:strand:+ start:268 stop:450 length:183 start_codon:yes stop_codon:yes gene_type:complete
MTLFLMMMIMIFILQKLLKKFRKLKTLITKNVFFALMALNLICLKNKKGDLSITLSFPKQ